ncbi:MAG: glycosyltransferase family 2 protein, partial [Blastocatellia bacterium]
LKSALAGVPHFVDLIAVVDDGSTDDTGCLLDGVSDTRIIRLCHNKNRGVGAATKTGYRFCLESGVDLIAVMDGDGQMDGRDLHLLLDRLMSGADYVRGNRFLHKQTLPAMPRDRYFGNLLFSALTRLAAGFRGTLDAQCGYSAIRGQALATLDLDHLYDRYGFPNELFFAARRAGLVIRDVPVRTIYGDEVSHINPIVVVPTVLLLILRNHLRLRRTKALKQHTAPGLAVPALPQASH